MINTIKSTRETGIKYIGSFQKNKNKIKNIFLNIEGEHRLLGEHSLEARIKKGGTPLVTFDIHSL